MRLAQIFLQKLYCIFSIFLSTVDEVILVCPERATKAKISSRLEYVLCITSIFMTSAFISVVNMQVVSSSYLISDVKI